LFDVAPCGYTSPCCKILPVSCTQAAYSVVSQPAQAHIGPSSHHPQKFRGVVAAECFQRLPLLLYQILLLHPSSITFT
jgi:hypothetical protein